VKRLAIFVEGETEQLFSEYLVREMATAAQLKIELREARGGKTTRRRNRIVEAVADNPDLKWYVLIVDCSGDGGVRSRIGEEYKNLTKHKYDVIIGLRDAPKNRSEIPRLRAGLPVGLPTDPLSVVFVLAIMEIEAWFLAEHTHLPKIDPCLTPAHIKAKLGFDPSIDNMQLRDRPEQDLNKTYELAGKRYQKGRAAQQTIYLLDCNRIVLEMVDKDDDLRRLVETIAGLLLTDEATPAQSSPPTTQPPPGSA
jgi:hypothetical protein